METVHRYRSDARRPLVNHHQPARVGILQGAKNHGIDDAEDRRSRTDPQRQRQDGGKSESGISSQLSQRIAHVLTEIAEPAEGVDVARVISGKGQVSETAMSFESGLLMCHPALYILIDTFVEMEPRFLGEIFVEIRAHNGAAETAKPTHDRMLLAF